MTIYEVFQQFYIQLFPASIITQYEPFFDLLTLITTFAFIFFILKGLKQIFRVFK